MEESLSPYTRDGEGGPTRTTTMQDRFAQRLRGVLSRINARSREAIIEDDLFLIREEQQTEALVSDVPEEYFEFETRERRVSAFLQWLRNQLDSEFLEIVGPDRNQFVRAAYAEGIRNAHRQLGDLDVAFTRPDMDDLLQGAMHASSLRTLYTRTYENLVDVRDDTAQAVRDTLVEGFAEGQSPTKIARSLTDRVDKIGKHRSTLIARSEVMNAHTEGTLTRVEELNKEVDNEIATGHGKWDAAMGQPNTCAFCRKVNGVELKPSEMRGTAVQFRGDVYRLAPPAHPNGRCNIGLRVGSTIDEPLSERLPAEVTLLT